MSYEKYTQMAILKSKECDWQTWPEKALPMGWEKPVRKKSVRMEVKKNERNLEVAKNNMKIITN